FLLEVLNRGKPETVGLDQIPEFAQRVNRFQAAVENLRIAERNPSSGKPGRPEAEPRDYQRLHRAMGEYLRATTDLLIHHENDLIPQAVRVLEGKLSRLSPEDIAALSATRGEMSERFQQIGEAQRKIFLELEPEIREFFRYYDTAIDPLREQG